MQQIYTIPLHLLRDYVTNMVEFLLVWQDTVHDHATMTETQQLHMLGGYIGKAHRTACAAHMHMLRNRPDFALPEYADLPVEVRKSIANVLELHGEAPLSMRDELTKRAYDLARTLHGFLAVPLRDWLRIEENTENIRT